MSYVVVVDGVFVGLLVQEVEHVLDGERQRAASVGRAEDGLEQVVHELLQRTLKTRTRERNLEMCKKDFSFCVVTYFQEKLNFEYIIY